jgi:hypothetical protein
MPMDFLLKTGDMIQITIPPPAIVPMIEAPVPLVGTSTSVTIMGMPACLLGDELPPELREPLPYTEPPFVTPGTGMLEIILAPNNITLDTMAEGPMLLKGVIFEAMFTVEVPAEMPTPAGPVPDPLVEKPGTAQFITTNVIVKGS